MFLHLSSIVLSLISIVTCYNLDLHNPIVIKDPKPGPSSRNTYFGYSVALFSTGAANDWAVLIGAPRANSSILDNVIEPGSVYVCNFNEQCKEWIVDANSDSRIVGRWSIRTQKRDYAWLGATIKVENSTHPKVAVCAPRWKIVMEGYQPMWYMNGVCFSSIINSTSDLNRVKAKKYFPLVDEDKQTVVVGKDVLYLNGMGESGFSLDLTEDRKLLIGAPGLFHWTGSAMLLGDRADRNPYDALVPNAIDEHFEHHDYFGYSVISGNFYTDSKELFAASAPRSSDTVGKVFVFTFPSKSYDKLIVKTTIVGEHIGEYFGSSLTSCDINNDGRDELIVGAPFWSKESDEGRIYIYSFQNKQDFSIDRINGKVESGRFGTSISCLGDLDYDGYADVAVGAPYDDTGAVFIFNGGSNGLDKSFSQVIRASNFPSVSLKGFGISISDPRDINGDRYPDVVIGSYSSGHAVILKAKPVVTLEVKIYRSENFTLMQNSTEFFINVCSTYNGAFVPYTLDVELALQIDEFFKRVIVYRKRLYGNIYKASITLKKGERMCIQVKVYLKKNLQNVIDPIDIAANVTSNDDISINPRSSSVSDFSKVAYVLDCGDDDICISDLNIRVTSTLIDGNRYIVGSKSNFNMTIFVENTMEPAYRALAHIYILKPIALARIPPECDDKSNPNNTLEIVCNIGNPLRYNNSITLELDMNDIKFTDDFTTIKVEVTTQSEEKDSSNNIQVLKVNYDVDADVKVLGKSYEDTYLYFDQNKDQYNYEKVTFSHIYEIWKSGILPIEEITILLNIPTHWNELEIATIDKIYSFINGKQHECDTVSNEEMKTDQINSLKAGNNSLLIPPDDRTLFVNCTDHETVCQRFQCKLSPFIKVQSMAKVNVTVNLSLTNLTSNEIKGKDILFFVSDGLAFIAQPNTTIASIKNSYNFKVSTIILGLSKIEKVSIWIIILSVLLGIFMLMMLALFLYKIGFFRRRLKEDMDALKPNDNTDYDNVPVN